MSTPSHPPLQPHQPDSERAAVSSLERLSSLVDGELGSSGLSPADDLNASLALWRQDADARQAWHRYQLIGDVMRSDDLAGPASRDLAFMNRLRQRLEDEPLHLAPSPSSALAPAPLPAPVSAALSTPAPMQATRRRWPAAALAASFAVAAVALLLARSGGIGADPQASPAVATAGSLTPAAGGVVAAGGGGVGVAALAVNSAGVLRDPRLDEFLRLHQMARGGLAVVAPGGTLQRADLQMPGGAER